MKRLDPCDLRALYYLAAMAGDASVQTDMTLISCCHCNRTISESASTCPGCGAPQPESGGCLEATLGCLVGIGWVLVGLIALAVLIMALIFVFSVVT